MERYKILLVDDERREREGISFLIERYGYPLEIRQAVNGQKALELMKEESFDILFTDVKMPIMDGLDLSKAVSVEYPQTIIIIFSAYSEFDYAKKAMEAGVVNYLLKPIELDEFQRCMEGVLKKLQEKKKLSSLQEEKELVKQAQLYRFFYSKKILPKDRHALEKFLFTGEKKQLVALLFELGENYFEQHTKNFADYAGAYFTSPTFVQMVGNEAYVLLHELESTDEEYLQQQTAKLLAAVRRSSGALVIVSKVMSSLEEVVDQLTEMDKIRKDFFLHEDRILFVNRHKDVVAFYQDNLEEIKNRIFFNIQQENMNEIREECKKLVHGLQNVSDLSRVYIHHLLYSVVKELYSKMPQFESEKSLAEMNELFDEKNPTKVLDNFLQAVESILAVASTRQNEQNSDLVGRIKNFIQKEYQGELSLYDVATKMNLNPSYISHVFKKETGQGVVEYITELKMEKAKLFLQDKNLKIVQIAERLGYNSQSYFNKCFKSYFGITPKQFREEL